MRLVNFIIFPLLCVVGRDAQLEKRRQDLFAGLDSSGYLSGSDDKKTPVRRQSYDKIHLPRVFFRALSQFMHIEQGLCEDIALFSEHHVSGLAGRRMQIIKTALTVVCDLLQYNFEEEAVERYYLGDGHVETLLLVMKPKSYSLSSFELTKVGKDAVECARSAISSLRGKTENDSSAAKYIEALLRSPRWGCEKST